MQCIGVTMSSFTEQVNLAEIHTFFDKHEVTAADREDYLLSLLGKVRDLYDVHTHKGAKTLFLTSKFGQREVADVI